MTELTCDSSKRRGAVKASITRLNIKLTELKRITHERTTGNLPQRMMQKLHDDFKKHHYAIIDVTEEGDEDSLYKEQEELDQHDDHIADLFMRLDQLAITCNLCRSRYKKYNHTSTIARPN